MNIEDRPSEDPIDAFLERVGHVDFGLTDMHVRQGSLKGAVEILKAVDLFEGYKLWTPGNIDRDLGGEQIVQCRSGRHEDKNPSLSLNKEKQVFYCFSCEWAGDIFDLGATKYQLQDYKEDTETFVLLLECMLADIGVDPNELRLKNAEHEAPHPVIIEPNMEADDRHGEVVDTSPFKTEAQVQAQAIREDLDSSALDWRTILGREEYAGGFLKRWMDTTCVLQSPDEYLFWVGLVGISTVMAKRVYLQTSDKVFSNSQVVLMGPTGIGKSRAVSPMKRLLRELYLDEDHNWRRSDHVVKIEGRAASGEALFDLFLTEDPTTGEKFTPGSVLLDVDEFSSLMATTGTRGGSFTETFIEVVDGPDMAIRTSIGRGRRIIRHPFLSTISSSQPDAIGAVVDQKFNRSGFANRWLFVGGTPKPQQKILHQATPDMSGLADMLGQLHSKAQSIDADPEKFFQLTPEAGDAWDDQHPIWTQRMQAENGELFARHPLHALRIALILAFCQNPKVGPLLITGQTMTDAIHILESNATVTSATSDSIVSTEEQWYRENVLEQISIYRDETNTWPSRTNIRNQLPSNKRNQVKLNDAFNYLLRIGAIEEIFGRNAAGAIDKRKKNYRPVE